MNKNTEQLLESYARVKPGRDLSSLEQDVNLRLQERLSGRGNDFDWMRIFFGLPHAVGLSAMAATLVLGIYVNISVNQAGPIQYRDDLGLEVFSSNNELTPARVVNVKK